jgi:hypothetical protein
MSEKIAQNVSKPVFEKINAGPSPLKRISQANTIIFTYLHKIKKNHPICEKSPNRVSSK